jgi:putative DNA primase/helicase
MSHIESAAHPQWVCWRKEARKGKVTKVPYNPRTGQRAKADSPATWTIYEQAYNAWKQRSQCYDGVGYVFSEERGITGIDLDHCIDEHGNIDPWAKVYLDTFASYSERSPGDGIHIIVYGSLPVHKGIRRLLTGERHPQAAIEAYDTGRYFTFTGKHLEETPSTIEERQEVLNALHAKLSGQEQRPAGNKQTSSKPGNPMSIGDDEQLLKRAEAAANGSKFVSLYYQGNVGDKSASEADEALCTMLAFWTGRDAARIDRLFRGSALYREKWDEQRGNMTYGERTIAKAIAWCNVVYHPQHRQEQLEREIDALLVRISGYQTTVGNRQDRKAAGGPPSSLVPKAVETQRVLEYLDMNEYGDALFFAEAFEDQVCYDYSEREWYLWAGHAWKKDSTGKMRLLVAGVLGSLYLKAAAELHTVEVELEEKLQVAQRDEDATNLDALKEQVKGITTQINDLQSRVRALRGARRTSNVLTFVQAEMSVTAEIWDRDPWVLAVANGVLDLRTGVLRDGLPSDYIRTVAPTAWTGIDTPCPRFEQFLEEVFADKPDRKDLIAFLHRLFGYGITGSTQDHIFSILYGEEGRNGKDTLLGTLADVLGPLAGAISNDVFIAQDRGKTGGTATPHLCDLQGKRLVWGSETRQGDKLNVALIKMLSGGGEIATRPLYAKDYYTFKPTHKLLLITNYKPHVDAKDKAAWERVCLIEFGTRFVDRPQQPNERKKDPTLQIQLKEERSGILAWLMRGCLAWQQQGLAIPESVQLATSRYRDEEDRVLLFIQECCVVAPGVWVKAQALYGAYKQWCEANQFGRAMNIKLFSEDIGKRFTKKHTEVGNIYQGIGMLNSEDSDAGLLMAEGSLKGAFSAFSHSKDASEANGHTHEGLYPEGTEGTLHKPSSIGGDLYISIEGLCNVPSATSPVNAHEGTSEANGERLKAEKAPFSDPSVTSLSSLHYSMGKAS